MSESSTTDIPSADILRLILAHLTESGLHQTCAALREESGLGMAGLFATSKGRLVSSAEEGRWGEALEILEGLDVERHRQSFLEDYRLHHDGKSSLDDVERRITSLSSLRTSSASNGASTALLLPVNYYGPSNQTQQKRRSQIAKLLKRLVPEVPMQRLASLLQQSVRWQCHTGVFPTIQRLFQNNDDEDGKISSAIDNCAVERIPSRSTQTIRLGKNSYIESAIFLPDGRGLVTGSSDGFIEIWGEPISEKGGTNINYENLRTSDLSYQRNDDLMMHDTAVLAMDVSNDGTLLGTTSSDGTVCVWKIMDGKLLRKLERAHGGSGGGDKGAAVTCIQFSPDGSKILTGGHDSTAREFGLLASRMLKEFRGHRSYVNCCSYAASGNALVVVTASADGNVRVWDGKTAEPMREITPPIPTSNAVSIHTVMHLHSPPQTMIVVPRTDRAYLMSYTGAVLRVFTRDDVQGTDFLAASVSPSNRWLFVAADDGKCVAFDVNTGKECSGRSEKASDITGIIHHPFRGLIGGYSNSKGQKRGILTLWK
ncbi:WD40-repeat protein [Thalassiosira pseudonana CCMP1335]|uniref:WD40-repeat protein n=1 Tax=Thalassiosira pseudonana TaxID=35128 RepID=B8C2V5_THAPS|nr:WD40-repeat protein [Thalassiosira pseudonana CCMP1335]EED92451.1 WD40-repeat protein [Thalassiosira pseudonana CCMP1335]